LKIRSDVPDRKFVRAKWGGPLGEQENRIYLPLPLFKNLGFLPGSEVTFKIGSLRRAVTAELVQSSSGLFEPVFFISPDIAGECRIFSGSGITLKYIKHAGILCCGPLIGLFTARNLFPESEFGSQELVLKALADSAPHLFGLVFVFCPEDIDWDMSSVTGYIPVTDQESGTFVWESLRLPLPDVIYDRIPSRTIEARPEFQEAKSKLMTLPNLSYFNPMFLNKWEIYLALHDVPEVAEYLPPTRLVESDDDIKEFFSLYNSVFLKPSSGSLGRRIIKVEVEEQGQYKFKYRSKDKQTIEGVAADFPTLTGLIKPVMGRRTYVIQKDLHLATYEGCPFDIRVLAQKDKWGTWRRTKIYVRIAAPGSFLSNLSDGARPRSVSAVLKEVFNVDFQAKDGLGEEIRQAVRKIPPAVEQGTGMNWGELGIDLGIDQSGRIYLIEINSKPFRALVSNSGSLKIIERSFMRPLEYAKYLAGFFRHSPIEYSPSEFL